MADQTITVPSDAVVMAVGTDPVVEVVPLSDGSNQWTAYTAAIGDTWTALTANIGRITERLNDKPTATFDVPRALSSGVSIVEKEVQFRRSGRVKFTGPVLSRQGGSNSGARSFSAAGVRWYLEKRFDQDWIDAYRRNFIANPRFDDGFTRYARSAPTTDFALDTVLFETGTQSVEITASTAHLNQTVHDVIFPQGAQVVVAARVYVEASVTSGSGLGVNAAMGYYAGADYDQLTIIDADDAVPTPRDEWTTLYNIFELPTTSPSSLTTPITVAVWGGVGGSVWVDNVSIKAVPLGAPAGVDPDAADVEVDIGELVSKTASGLNLGVDADGVSVMVAAQGQRDRSVDEMLRLFTEPGTRNVYVGLTPNTRTLRAPATQGVEHDPTDITLRFDVGEGNATPRGNLSSYSFAEDGAAALSAVTMIGETGFRGYAVDDAAWGGLLLEDVAVARSGTSITSLEPLARQTLADASAAAQTLTAVVSDRDLYEVLELGDRVTVVIDAESIDDLYRIVGVDWSPAPDLMTLTLEPWVE